MIGFAVFIPSSLYSSLIKYKLEGKLTAVLSVTQSAQYKVVFFSSQRDVASTHVNRPYLCRLGLKIADIRTPLVYKFVY